MGKAWGDVGAGPAHLAKEADSVGLPLHSVFGPRDSKSNAHSPDWKSEHKLLWEKFPDKIPGKWPLDMESWTEAVYVDHPAFADIRFHGFYPREAEAVVLLHCLFEPRSKCEFIDVNPSLTRVVDTLIDSDSDEIKGTPWRSTPPTLVGSGRLVMRHVRDGKLPPLIRIVESFELARMIGWADNLWSSKPTSSSEQTADGLALISNMVGNAFSLFQFGPFQMAILSTYGKYHYTNQLPAATDADDGESAGGVPESSYSPSD